MLSAVERDEVYRRIAARVARDLLDEGGERLLREELRAAVERERGLELLDASQVGELLRIPAKSVHGLAKSGQLPALQVGKHRRWRRGDVAAFVTVAEATVSNGQVIRAGGDP